MGVTVHTSLGPSRPDGKSHTTLCTPLPIQAAGRWIDKEIRKLIDAIVEHGTLNGKTKVTITYKTLFDATDQIFEALSGTLKIVSLPSSSPYLFLSAQALVLALKPNRGGTPPLRTRSLSHPPTACNVTIAGGCTYVCSCPQPRMG